MITLNTLEIITSNNEVSIYSQPYNGNWEILRQFRKDCPLLNFHQWKNHETGEHPIYCWSLNNDYSKLPNSFTPITITAQSHANIWTKILESSFVSFMQKRENKLFKHKYSYIWEMELDKTKSKNFKGLIEKPILRFSFHYLYSETSKKNNFFISIRKSYSPELIYTEHEYIANNIDIRRWKKNREGQFIANRQNIKRLLLATGQTRLHSDFKKKVKSQSTEYTNLLDFQKNFNTVSELIQLPDGIIFSKFILSNLPNYHFQAQKIRKPQYYFHNEATGGGFYNDRLKELKPASFDSFKNESLKILVISPKEYEGTVGSFSSELLKILRTTFHIKNISQELITFDSRKPYAYSSLLKELNVDNIDLVVQVLKQNDKLKEIKYSPYYVFKAKLINQKTPSQKVLIETILKNDKQTKDSIALNIYSKLGGTAWTIEKDEKDKTEVIIGVGSTIDFNKNRVMGFASVLDYRGKFLTGECTQISDLNDYSKNLESHLTSIIDRIIKTKNITEGESFRLIFHLTKEAGKKNEIKAIETSLKSFKKYNIQFGIVHLSYSHNYRIYSNKGIDFPERGTFIRLSYNQGLLHLGNRTTVPILVRRDHRSTYDDLFDMTKHILHFSHLSHRSYRPSSRPVTILYPSIMAKLISDLKEVPNWDKIMIDKLNSKLWFI